MGTSCLIRDDVNAHVQLLWKKTLVLFEIRFLPLGIQIVVYLLVKKFQVIILRLGPIGPKRGETWRLEGISLNIDNALSAIKLSIDTNKELWYEFFTITDDVSNSDISKAKTILNYKPI